MDEHRWHIPSGTATADRIGIKVNGPTGENYIVGGTVCNEEILRLADFEDEAARLRLALEEMEEAAVERDGRMRLLEDAEVETADSAMRALAGRDAETALLRRERALLIELEKTRTRILASIFETGGGCSAEDVRHVGELLMAVEALHMEASGGVERPPGVGCACVLCRPEGA